MPLTATQPVTRLGKGAWPAQPAKAPKSIKVYSGLAIDSLTLTDDKLPAGRLKPGSKYHDLFQQAHASGKAISTPLGKASTVSNICRAWLKREGIANHAPRCMNNFGDGKGRVWIVAVGKKGGK